MKPGFVLLIRRPLFIAFVLGCVASLLASGTLTARIVLPTAVCWTFVPLVQMLALRLVTWRNRLSFPALSDLFFAGHTPWTAFLIVLAASMASLAPEFGWGRLRMWLFVAIAVSAWSVYVDFRFFRSTCERGRLAAIRDVAVCRLLSWPVIFAIFAVPATSPRGVAREVVEAVQELMR